MESLLEQEGKLLPDADQPVSTENLVTGAGSHSRLPKSPPTGENNHHVDTNQAETVNYTVAPELINMQYSATRIFVPVTHVPTATQRTGENVVATVERSDMVYELKPDAAGEEGRTISIILPDPVPCHALAVIVQSRRSFKSQKKRKRSSAKCTPRHVPGDCFEDMEFDSNKVIVENLVKRCVEPVEEIAKDETEEVELSAKEIIKRVVLAVGSFKEIEFDMRFNSSKGLEACSEERIKREKRMTQLMNLERRRLFKPYAAKNAVRRVKSPCATLTATCFARKHRALV